MIEYTDMTDFFFKFKVKEKDYIKDWFLSEHQDWLDYHQGRATKNGNKSEEWFTDHFTFRDNESVIAPYEEEWKSIIHPYMADFCAKWGALKYDCDWWAAQYGYGVEHEWHTHPNAQFAVVYNLELPFNQNSTEFWKKEFPAEEGDLVFFPSWWIHRSAAHTFNKRKTIIAGNLNLLDWNLMGDM